jgi:azurin
MPPQRLLGRLCPLLLLLGFLGQIKAADLFDKPNLAAWCIVPFDKAKRSPEARAEMVAKMGIKKIAYDWRAEHVPEFEREILAYQKHGIEFFAFWGLHEEAFRLFEKYDLHPQLWVMLKVAGDTEQTKVKAAAEALLPTLDRARKLGCQVGIYNHGGWGGEPESMVAVCEYLRANHGTKNVGIAYNLHHGHGHLERLPTALAAMKPWLLCLNLNGMDIAGDAKGRKILPLGAGTEDVTVLRQIRASGYTGPIGILNHTNEDAEGRLLDNLDGLQWLVPQLGDAKPSPKPKYRTWSEKPEVQAAPSPESSSAESVDSINADFGKALKGGWLADGSPEFAKPPFTVECRAQLNGKSGFNILVASEPKASSTHWELYTMAKSGGLAIYMPGRGGNFDSKVDVCDGKWHDLLASVDENGVALWIDGKQVLNVERALPSSANQSGAERSERRLAFGRLVEGAIGCDGIIDDVRISRGVMKPRNSAAPRERMDNTLGLWSFDKLAALLPPPAPKPAAFQPALEPLDKGQNIHWRQFVNRERVFDFYGKQALSFMTQKPLPELLPQFPGLDGGKQGHWGNQNDKETWRDGRFAESDLGNVFSTVFRGAGLTIAKAVCVRYEDKAACFDPTTLSFPLVWTGGFVKLTEHRHGFGGGGALDGTVVKKEVPRRLEKPFQYHGFYRHGREVVFSYTLDGKPHLTTAKGEDPQLERLVHGGPSQWPQWIETRGESGSGEPFATDRITIPFKNPYGTLFFISGHDFFRDGSAAVATMTGEVWLVRGIDDGLEHVRWKRFATGLHQPLGVKIVDDKIFVLGRDQITRLHDLNGDDEADFYECVTNAMATSAGGHDYITGLDADAQGRWYFASGNQGICRITGRDNLEALATGLRNPNGLGLSPDGHFITSSVQEGDWTPASAICLVETGKKNGLHFGARGLQGGQLREPPLLYLPRGEDNSSGGQAFVTGAAWEPLKADGNLVHLSTGGGSAWLVMRQSVRGQWQGAAVRISGNFDSGVQAGRFHPRDGHFYATGMQGWGSYTPLDGCFQRVRFSRGTTPVPVAFEARENGVLLRFETALDAAHAGVAANHFAQCWNYRYSAAYGSPEYSLRYPETPGHDPLEIRSAHVLDGGKSLFVEIPQLAPAGQVHLHVRVSKAKAYDIFLTAHGLAQPFTGFPGYTAVPKALVNSHAEHHAAHHAVDGQTKPAPVSWEGGAPGRALHIQAATGLQYAQKELHAKAGERLTLVFDNPDVMPHNWVLLRPDSTERVGELANKLITAPNALTRHYVPESPDILCHTRIVEPQKQTSIHFNAPAERGKYPYICTFPGHWALMRGVLVID